MEHNQFSARQIATTGYEILSPDGEVFAWTIDSTRAAVVVAALNEHLARSPQAHLHEWVRGDREVAYSSILSLLSNLC
jgi:hypothetical protein